MHSAKAINKFCRRSFLEVMVGRHRAVASQVLNAAAHFALTASC
jgi:hypothetical protein